MKATRFLPFGGFTMIEVLAALAILAAVGGIGYVAVSNTKTNADSSKLASDVDSINRSITIFQANGGNLAGLNTTDEVLNKLKTKGDSTTLGATGSTLDARVYAVYQTSAEGATSSSRAVWNSSAIKFQVNSSGPAGVKEFRLNEDLASSAPTTDSTRVAVKTTSAENGWVWGHAPAVEVASAVGTTPQTGVASSGAAVMSNLGLNTGDFLVVDPLGDGKVTFQFGYREAGYSQRLGMFSLKGMDIYDLTTDAGRKAFLLEAMRRVLSDTTAGRVVLDASKSTPGSTTSTYDFDAGDSLGAITIPNSDFQTAMTALANDKGTLAAYSASNAQKSPLVSVSKVGEDIPSFYSKQYVSLGNGVYAVEDMPTLTTGSLGDYQDMVFTAVGLSPSVNMNKLMDASGNPMSATAYYTTGPGKTNAPSGWNWDQKPNGSTKSLHQFLYEQGVEGVTIP